MNNKPIRSQETSGDELLFDLHYWQHCSGQAVGPTLNAALVLLALGQADKHSQTRHTRRQRGIPGCIKPDCAAHWPTGALLHVTYSRTILLGLSKTPKLHVNSSNFSKKKLPCGTSTIQ